MAVSSSILKGQVSICCNLCEEETKVNWKCIDCNMLMCTKCKIKIHPKFKSAEEHKIIDIKEIGKYSVTLDFKRLTCQKHAGQFCCLFCKSCDNLVCSLCITQVHNGHGLIEISEAYKNRIESLSKEQKQLGTYAEEIKCDEDLVNALLVSEKLKYDLVKKEIMKQENKLKNLVDEYIGKLSTEIDKEWKVNQRSIEMDKNKLGSLIKRMHDESNKIASIIDSKSAATVLTEVRDTRKVEEIMTREKLDFPRRLPYFVPGVLTQINVGTFQRNPALTVITRFETDLPTVSRMSTCNDGSLWISDQETVLRVTSDGTILTTVNTEVNDMASYYTNDLLAITSGSYILPKIIGCSGEVTDSDYSINPWFPLAVHVAADNSIVIGAFIPDQNPDMFTKYRTRALLVLKPNKTQTVYRLDSENRQIFTYIRAVTTKDGSIYVVDSLTSDWIGRVVILNRGIVVNIYEGHPDIQPFKPSSIATTPMGNIIVSDPDTHTIHILNSFGNLISCLNTKEIGISYPTSVGFHHNGVLFIGCSREKNSFVRTQVYIGEISGF